VHGEPAQRYRIINIRTGEAITLPTLIQDIGNRLVLVGEIHDNIFHHELQGDLIRALSPAVIVTEHISEDQIPALNEFAKQASPSVEQFPSAINWAKNWGDDFTPFKPLYSAALSKDAEIRPGLLGRKEIKRIYQAGVGAVISGKEQARFGIGKMPESSRQNLLRELVDSHCGMLDEKSAAPLVPVQQARDAYLAMQIANHVGRGQILVVAGNGHVRRDRGVPFYLAAADGPEPVVIVQLEAPSEGGDDAMHWRSLELADFVVVSEAVDRPDPCAAMHDRKKAR
jgi:uncharacterized iron-regulated protein